ncbi:gamma-aminobutyric acid type B receptor subunit 2-like [Ptychodera flava]|uniref:gamma-aminobutyric acid type B receptor subunit 2-like n=1 Tax=Ptychodera flava TaxID=63121 RepID=UPI00396A746C
MKYFNWTRVATVYGQQRMFVEVIADLIDRMGSQDIDLLMSLAIDYDPAEQLRNIKETDGRIIALHSYEDEARSLLCAAFQLGMYGKNYAWMIPSWWTRDWWRQSDQTINCTADEMDKAVESAIGTGPVIEDASSNQETINGETFDEYEERYEDRFKTHDEYRNLDPHGEHGYGYDAIWAIALVLNSSINQVGHKTIADSNGEIRQKRLDDFTYTDRETAQIFKKSFQNVTFRGTTGTVSFNEHGDRIGKTAIYQIQDGISRFIGECDSEGNMVLSSLFQWQGDHPPLDSEQTMYKIDTITDTVFLAVFIVCIFGAILAMSFLVFNVRHRNHGYVKLSSPRMNYMVVVGALLVNLAIIADGLVGCSYVGDDLEIRNLFCVTEKWFFSVGFSLAFGSMFAKTWRVHRIFTNFQAAPMTEPIHDTNLIAFVICLTLIDVVFLTSWQLIHPCETYLKTVRQEISAGVNKTVTQVFQCSSAFYWWWSGALLVQKGLLLLFGCFLSYEIRNITVEGLNDSRLIGISIYNIFLSSVIGITLQLVLEDNTTVKFILISALTVLCFTSTLCMMFIPKVSCCNGYLF